MARNAQLWSHDFRLLLDGPNASSEDIRRAVHEMHEGGLFGYRFLFPAMRVGRHEVYWHRPLVAYMAPAMDRPLVLHDAPAGYCTAYRADKPNLARPVEMRPYFLKRDLHQAAIELFSHVQDHRPHLTVRNLRKLLDTHHLLGRPLPYSLARQLLTLSKKETMEECLHQLVDRAAD